MIHDKTIRVGACDWDHASWRGDFYPDDLPKDWRLSYYANEFSCVLVTEAIWRSAGDALIDWLDDIDEGFLFYFASASLSEKDEKNLQGIFGCAFGGMLYPQTSEMIIIDYSTRSLREWKNWLMVENAQAIFLMGGTLMGDTLSAAQCMEFKSLVELMGK